MEEYLNEYCMYCMNELDENGVCKVCGETNADCEIEPHILPTGTVLKGRYLLGAAIGEGGFGVTYIGRDLVLNMRVAVKEYFPFGAANRSCKDSYDIYPPIGGYMSYETGKKRFISEAKILAKFSEEPGIVSIRSFFEENQTAYIVMEYLDGKTLKEHLEEVGRIDYVETVKLLTPVMESLEKLHKNNLLHRDISPDNIMFSGNKVKLIDFGAVKDLNEDEKTRSVVLKHGYAPLEQYRKQDEGPWTDIYALCAVMYRCITGEVPVEALARIDDEWLKPPSMAGVSVDPFFELILMFGLEVRPNERFRSIGEMLVELSKVPEFEINYVRASDVEASPYSVEELNASSEFRTFVKTNFTMTSQNTEFTDFRTYVEEHTRIDDRGITITRFQTQSPTMAVTQNPGNTQFNLPRVKVAPKKSLKGVIGVCALLLVVSLGVLTAAVVKQGGNDEVKADEKVKTAAFDDTGSVTEVFVKEKSYEIDKEIFKEQTADGTYAGDITEQYFIEKDGFVPYKGTNIANINACLDEFKSVELMNNDLEVKASDEPLEENDWVDIYVSNSADGSEEYRKLNDILTNSGALMIAYEESEEPATINYQYYNDLSGSHADRSSLIEYYDYPDEGYKVGYVTDCIDNSMEGLDQHYFVDDISGRDKEEFREIDSSEEYANYPGKVYERLEHYIYTAESGREYLTVFHYMRFEPNDGAAMECEIPSGAEAATFEHGACLAMRYLCTYNSNTVTVPEYKMIDSSELANKIESFDKAIA